MANECEPVLGVRRPRGAGVWGQCGARRRAPPFGAPRTGQGTWIMVDAQRTTGDTCAPPTRKLFGSPPSLGAHHFVLQSHQVDFVFLRAVCVTRPQPLSGHTAELLPLLTDSYPGLTIVIPTLDSTLESVVGAREAAGSVTRLRSGRDPIPSDLHQRSVAARYRV